MLGAQGKSHLNRFPHSKLHCLHEVAQSFRCSGVHALPLGEVVCRVHAETFRLAREQRCVNTHKHTHTHAYTQTRQRMVLPLLHCSVAPPKTAVACSLRSANRKEKKGGLHTDRSTLQRRISRDIPIRRSQRMCSRVRCVLVLCKPFTSSEHNERGRERPRETRRARERERKTAIQKSHITAQKTQLQWNYAIRMKKRFDSSLNA